MDANGSITDRFPDDMVDFASMPVPFRSFMDGDRRFCDPDRGERSRVVARSDRLRPIQERNRHVPVPSPTKNVVGCSKTVRFLVEIVAFMSKTVPLRSVMVLFLSESVRYFCRNSGNVEIRNVIARPVPSLLGVGAHRGSQETRRGHDVRPHHARIVQRVRPGEPIGRAALVSLLVRRVHRLPGLARACFSPCGKNHSSSSSMFDGTT